MVYLLNGFYESQKIVISSKKGNRNKLSVLSGNRNEMMALPKLQRSSKHPKKNQKVNFVIFSMRFYNQVYHIQTVGSCQRKLQGPTSIPLKVSQPSFRVLYSQLKFGNSPKVSVYFSKTFRALFRIQMMLNTFGRGKEGETRNAQGKSVG